MADLQDLQDKLAETVDALDATIDPLISMANQRGISDGQRNALISEISVLQLKRTQTQTTYLLDAAQTKEFAAAIAQLDAINQKMLLESEQIKDVTSGLNTAAKVLGYVAQAASIIIPFL